MFSLIIINWKRPKNTIEIANKMIKYKNIKEIIITNGNKENEVIIENDNIISYDDSEYNSMYGTIKFITLRANNEEIIMIDDDVDITETELDMVIDKFNENKNKLVGVTGRNIEKGYEFKDRFDPVDVVLTKLLICKRELCKLFFICKPLIENIYKQGKPYGNGEDIFFSFITGIYLKTKHVCVYVGRGTKERNLDQSHQISNPKNHLKYRKKLCKYLLDNKDKFEKFIRNIEFKTI